MSGVKKDNYTIGDRYKDVVCLECQARILRETKKLSKVDLLFPHKTAKKFAKLLCPACKKKLTLKLQKDYSRKPK